MINIQKQNPTFRIQTHNKHIKHKKNIKTPYIQKHEKKAINLICADTRVVTPLSSSNRAQIWFFLDKIVVRL